MPEEYQRHRLSSPDTLEEISVGQGLTVTNVAVPFRSLRQRGEVVREIGKALNLTSEALATAETFEHIETLSSIAIKYATSISAQSVRSWFGVLGSDLSIDFSVDDLDPTFFKDCIQVELRAADDPVEALASFQQQALAVVATQGDSVSVGVRLSIGKRQAQRLAGQALAERRTTARADGAAALAPEAALVFYSAAACERLLTLRATPDWGKRGLGGGETRLCVLICDATGYLTGPALEVIGAGDAAGGAGASTDDWLPVSRAAWRRFGARAAAARRLRDAESAWSGFTLALTPDDAHVTQRAPGLERIALRLQALRAQVAACALASHVERAESGADGVVGAAGAGRGI